MYSLYLTPGFCPGTFILHAEKSMVLQLCYNKDIRKLNSLQNGGYKGEYYRMCR